MNSGGGSGFSGNVMGPDLQQMTDQRAMQDQGRRMAMVQLAQQLAMAGTEEGRETRDATWIVRQADVLDKYVTSGVRAKVEA